MTPRRRRKRNTARPLIRFVALLTAALVILVAAVLLLRPKDSDDGTLNADAVQSDPVSESTGGTPAAEDTDATAAQGTAESATAALSPAELDPDIPDYGEYVDVGTGYIVEIVTYTAETFNGQTTDDYSAPTRSYLPEGTVDYASSRIISNSTMDYMLLRCGRRVYVEKNNNPGGKLPVVTCYEGTLPDHNEIDFVSVTQEGHFTILTLDVLWKAPFYVNIGPQEYVDPAIRDYRVTEFTAEYIDITFCYATEFTGTVTIAADDPLFRGAVVVQGAEDCTLRLYLKQTGGLSGYDTYYNEDGQLCFKFLHHVSATATDSNAYGVDLSGIRIMIDVGHGGTDCGAVATGSDGTTVYESNLNLSLAKTLQQELESMGAEVILNRTENTTLKVDERTEMLKDVWPDICICIHQNSCAEDTSVSGLQVCYSTPMSWRLSTLLYRHTMDTGIYAEGSTAWHYYFVAKQTNCPVVLMECGYMTNSRDMKNMQSPTVRQQKAQAMAAAVAEYFLGQ